MSWYKIDKSLKQKLVETRAEIGVERQTEFSSDFNNLMAVFDSASTFPFDEQPEFIYEKLISTCPYFKEGGHWDAGDLSNNAYFYRIETFESFLRKNIDHLHQNNWRSSDKIPMTSDESQVYDNFLIICDDYETNDKTWQPLLKLASSYFSFRNFSWWTNDFNFNSDGRFPSAFGGADLTTENKWLLEFAFKVGISSDWLSNHMLFMRLDSSQMNSHDIRIPSIIDALLQPIFSPRKLNLNTRWGLAFDLNRTIKPTHREYVLKNIPINAIEYFPVRVDINTIDAINAGARLNSPMIEALIENI